MKIVQAFEIFLPDERSLLQLGEQLGQAILTQAVVFLDGPLGAGKTTFCRGFMRGKGYTGHVKSPTYTIVEVYDLDANQVCHFDFYRLRDPQELEYIGIQDYFHEQAICLIEWPEFGQGLLPPPDLSCYIQFQAEGRQMTLTAKSAQGEIILQRLKQSV
jgi:tRNA threonylcarbamoyladenosine biosynthesis protein TsaE